ncbi:hypothetical protein STCU_11891 [Strigomonas culicis]|uniref:Uncharacterized protein n=1 Tax=Strigomonas culicis TaxID=28005 RepID=S9ULS9_9TRYP|nr:hypothetical protein STCU_11891 [Strigomonas culicis]|eukprot:EPY15611.1 hypothetical protein STCU_11891 [Strigomonas culicis]
MFRRASPQVFNTVPQLTVYGAMIAVHVCSNTKEAKGKMRVEQGNRVHTNSALNTSGASTVIAVAVVRFEREEIKKRKH